MFSPDIVTFRQFYASRLGMALQRILTQRILKIWPSSNGDCILGIGYASPYLDPYLEESDRVIICMPAHQGAAYWPTGKTNRVFLAHESALPLQENSINRILMVHSIENSEQLSWMMDEAWRVLTPGGRLLVVAPNRLGLWSHFGSNPFGSGRPFSKSQIKDLLGDHDFTMLHSEAALFMPPSNYPNICRLAERFEQLGEWLYPILGGVWIAEAEKQVYASMRQQATVRRGYHVPVRAAKPAMGLKYE